MPACWRRFICCCRCAAATVRTSVLKVDFLGMTQETTVRASRRTAVFERRSVLVRERRFHGRAPNPPGCSGTHGAANPFPYMEPP
jgi:hypothetical protein